MLCSKSGLILGGSVLLVKFTSMNENGNEIGFIGWFETVYVYR